MNAYPISSKMTDRNLNDISLIQPTGNTVYFENATKKNVEA
jgi:hypothetical protein